MEDHYGCREREVYYECDVLAIFYASGKIEVDTFVKIVIYYKISLFLAAILFVFLHERAWLL